jgi:hypothetical protein
VWLGVFIFLLYLFYCQRNPSTQYICWSNPSYTSMHCRCLHWCVSLYISEVTYIKISFSSYIVWIRKGYQDIEEPRDSSMIKVKGVARVAMSNSNFTTGKFVSFSIKKREHGCCFYLHFQLMSNKLYGMPVNT